MAIALVAHTKFIGSGNGGTTSPINTAAGNFAILFYTFYNGTDYPVLSDSVGNNLSFNDSRENAFSPALASEFRFTHEFVGNAAHTFTIGPSGTYPGGMNACSLYVAVFSGVKMGSNSSPIFSDPWYNDGGNNTTVASSLACNTGASAAGGNGKLIIVGWGNSDPNHNTTITAVDGLAGTPTFTIIDSDQAVLPLPGLTNYNAGLAYYVQPVATTVTATTHWQNYVDLYPHDGANGQAVMSAGVFLPAPASPGPPFNPGPAGRRTFFAELGPVRKYT